MAKPLQIHIKENFFEDPTGWGNYRILQGQSLSILSRCMYKIYHRSTIVKFQTGIGKPC
jgi:hypothetical protein